MKSLGQILAEASRPKVYIEMPNPSPEAVGICYYEDKVDPNENKWPDRVVIDEWEYRWACRYDKEAGQRFVECVKNQIGLCRLCGSRALGTMCRDCISIEYGDG